MFALSQVVSPASSERSDTDSRSQGSESKKTVTFTTASALPAPATIISITTAPESSRPVVATSQVYASQSATSTGLTVSTTSQPSSILKMVPPVHVIPAVSATPATDSQMVRTSAENCITNHGDLMKLRSSAAGSSKSNSFTASDSAAETLGFQSGSGNSLAEISTIGQSAELKCDNMHIKEEFIKVEEPVPTGQEPVSVTDANSQPVSVADTNSQSETKPTVKTENCLSSETKITLQCNTVGGNALADVTKPLSIETKFNTSPCAASSESTDTASEIGSGFSSPGSLNTSSCQSSPQFSDGNTTAGK